MLSEDLAISALKILRRAIFSSATIATMLRKMQKDNYFFGTALLIFELFPEIWFTLA